MADNATYREGCNCELEWSTSPQSVDPVAAADAATSDAVIAVDGASHGGK